MAKLVAKTYGDALFTLALEENKTDILCSEVESLVSILKDNPELKALMNHPKITREEKLKVVEDVFKGRLDDELTGFLVLLLKKDRYSELDAILEYFTAKVKEFKGIGVAFVTSAVELRDAQKDEIKNKLLATTDYRQMEMHYIVDKSLIGGVIIRLGDRVVDSSIRTRLEGIKKELVQLQIA
ncbi:MAG: F0F1 ATP synthase subunit delta [Lachnospiraceae bacterium]|nr:F0F1 ATP synthase subunit delta [Lachnospiraceae bacterium]